MESAPGSTETLDIAQRFINALNQGDREGFTSYLAQDAVWHSAATGETENGRDDVSRNLFGYRGGFPDLHEEIFNAFAAGDQVAVETAVSGTYGGGEIPTIPGSGRHVNLQLCYILRVHNGKVVNLTTYMDYRTLMAQLDMIMAPTTTP